MTDDKDLFPNDPTAEGDGDLLGSSPTQLNAYLHERILHHLSPHLRPGGLERVIDATWEAHDRDVAEGFISE